MSPYLRQSDGDLPATVEYRVPSRRALRAAALTPEVTQPEGIVFEYDDGNGMWITSGVSDP